MVLKSFIKSVTTSKQRVALKRFKRHAFEIFLKKNKTSLEDIKKILIDNLGIKKNDKIIVASSFGNLNADFSPADIIHLLQSIVSEEGCIMMPYYPPINSNEWAKGNYIFDMSKTKSGMGILTNVFARMPDVYMSVHPTKAVCIWGKDAENIVHGHSISETPFYWDSPYGKFIKGSKSLGLGLKNIPIFHTLEDVLSVDKFYYYYKEKKKLSVIDKCGKRMEVETYIHNSELLSECVSAGDYVASLHCKTYKRLKLGYGILYIIDNDDLFQSVKYEFSIGNTRLKKHENNLSNT